jgi:hypothetical protein
MVDGKKKSKNSGQDMDDVPVPNRGKKVMPSEIVDIYDIPNKWSRIRYHGPIFSYGLHWVKTKTKAGKETKFPVPCLAFDAATGRVDPTHKCPWCAHPDKEQIQFGVEHWTNAIIRKYQDAKPSKLPKPTKEELKTGLKEKESETWTPNRAVRLTGGALKQLKDLKALNTHEVKGETMAYAVSHPKYGIDVNCKVDPNAAQGSKFAVQQGSHTPLDAEEKEYFKWDLSALHVADDLETAKSEYKSWLSRNGGKAKGKDDDDDDDEDDTPKKKKKVVDDDEDEDEKPAKKGKKAVIDNEDDEDDDDDDDDDEDEEDEKPAKKGKSKKPVDDDEDEEDEKPAKKGKSKKPVDDDEDEEDEKPAKKGKKVVEDDDDDEDDEPPKKSKAKTKKKPVDDEDDDDDDDDEDNDDDEDEEDEKPAKKGKSAAKKVAKKGGKKAVVEDDDEDEDDDDDEDEDEPPPKKGKSKAPVKKGKKKPVDEDDDD